MSTPPFVVRDTPPSAPRSSAAFASPVQASTANQNLRSPVRIRMQSSQPTPPTSVTTAEGPSPSLSSLSSLSSKSSTPSFSPSAPVVQTKCIFDLLEKIELLPERAGVSSALLLFGVLRATVLPNAPSRKVAVKIALFDNADGPNNSLATERKMYMHIHDTVMQKTPHVLEGLFEGTCSDESLLQASDKVLQQTWRVFRLKAIWDRLPLATHKDMLAQTEQVYPGKPVTMVLLASLFPMFKLEPVLIGFIVTPRVFASALDSFLTTPMHTLTHACFLERDVLNIAAQVAQALAVLKEEGIMHHDLHDGNVLIKRLATDTTLSYDFPRNLVADKPLTLKTRFFVSIYDFDHASGRGFVNSTLDTHSYCIAFGECNEFVPNFDWYTFLTYYIRSLRKARIPVPNVLETILRGNDAKSDAWVGRPCTCTSFPATPKERCTQCTLKRHFLENMMGPAAFFRLIAK